ncbi:MAG TPA: B12-binding domain-containing radical SAM protein [Planctomycetes bacterium]|nr:B12-binding domain-containing radical SAM protein [Planctomycetota bacterium]
MNFLLEPTRGRDPLGKIILIFPRFQEEIYPLWLPYEIMVLGTALSEAGYAVRIVDERGDPTAIAGLIDEARDALFVGVSSRPGDQVIRALEIFRLLEDHHSAVPAVWGGWFPSSFPDACLAVPEVDFVVQGAADTSIVALAERLRLQDGDVTGVPGLNGCLPDRPVVRNPRRRLEDIDATPRVDWSRFPISDYVTPDGCLSYYTSRGCPGRCRFCGVTRLYPASWTGYSPERVLDDLEVFARRFGVRIVKIWDVDFFGDVDRALAICRGIVERGLPIRWIADIRAAAAATLTEDDWRLIAAAGCAELELGAETASESQLESIFKECGLDEIRRSVAAIVRHGIAARVNFVLGFPGESRATLKQSLAMIDELQRLGALVRFHFYRFVPSPSTRLGHQVWSMDEREHDGRIPEDVESLNAIALGYHRQTMFWIEENLERDILRWLGLFLPLGYYLGFNPGTSPIVRGLAAIARARVRRGISALPIEALLLKLLRVQIPITREFEWEVSLAAANSVLPGGPSERQIAKRRKSAKSPAERAAAL